MVPSLLSLTPAALAEKLGGSGRAQAVLGLLRRGEDPFAEGALPKGALQRLADHTAKTEATVTEVDEAQDGTLKTVVSFRDERRVEMVLIPSAERTTLCISSQVGCKRGCRFCLTATMGLKSNLAADEIAAQVVIARRIAREKQLPRLKNLVLMGMGEPLDNLENVEKALALITAENGLGIGHNHVTVSTVAPSPEAVKQAKNLPAHLAWSLHAADRELRKKLIPTAKHSVEALRDAFAEALQNKPLFVEVTLIHGVNDQPEHAAAIATLFDGFPSEVRVNLLPMNRIADAPSPVEWSPSTPENVEAFKNHLTERGLRTMVRRARGADRRAACGQLVVVDRRS